MVFLQPKRKKNKMTISKMYHKVFMKLNDISMMTYSAMTKSRLPRLLSEANLEHLKANRECKTMHILWTFWRYQLGNQKS